MRSLTLDKLSRPTAVRDPGPEPSQGWLPVDKLVIDPEYQREVRLNQRAADRVLQSFVRAEQVFSTWWERRAK